MYFKEEMIKKFYQKSRQDNIKTTIKNIYVYCISFYRDQNIKLGTDYDIK